MPVAPQQNFHTRPVAADTADDMAQYAGGFCAGGALAGAQDGGDGLPGSGLEDQDRLEAIIPGMGVEQTKLLVACTRSLVSSISSVISLGTRV